MKPFVDYYMANNISPVAQDVSDLALHFERRQSLYLALGLIPSFLAGKSVMEIGAGSGYNALHTWALGPQRYLLVDGNPVGIAECRRLFAQYFSSAPEIVESLIDDFRTDERFDLALCEGMIPFQMDPGRVARMVGDLVRPGGALVITCVDAASCLGEITRRLIAAKVVDRDASTRSKLELLRPVFASHLATLKNMSRPIDDWILDNVIQPLPGKTYSIVDAIESLERDFDVYGHSPSFVIDWRWYKDIVSPAKAFNALAAQAYLRNVASFMDYRQTLAPHSIEVGLELRRLCLDVYRAMQAFEAQRSDSLEAAVAALRALCAVLRPEAARTAESLGEVLAFLESDRGDASSAFTTFASFFGRGQQYVSFIKRVDALDRPLGLGRVAVKSAAVCADTA